MRHDRASKLSHLLVHLTRTPTRFPARCLILCEVIGDGGRGLKGVNIHRDMVNNKGPNASGHRQGWVE